jgi:hypothetical protein
MPYTRPLQSVDDPIVLDEADYVERLDRVVEAVNRDELARRQRAQPSHRRRTRDGRPTSTGAEVQQARALHRALGALVRSRGSMLFTRSG